MRVTFLVSCGRLNARRTLGQLMFDVMLHADYWQFTRESGVDVEIVCGTPELAEHVRDALNTHGVEFSEDIDNQGDEPITIMPEENHGS